RSKRDWSSDVCSSDLGLSVATGATILAGGKLLGSTVRAGLALIAPGTATNPVFKIGGDLEVNRLGFGAMRLTGEGVWGWPPDRRSEERRVGKGWRWGM